MAVLSRIEENKKKKRERIIEAALDFYIEQGKDPSVDDITKEAKVAKGTFYLYYPDKSKLENDVVVILANRLIKKAVGQVVKLDELKAVDMVIAFTDLIIDYLGEREGLLKFIKKNLSWGLYEKIRHNEEELKDVKDGIEMLCNGFKEEFKDTRFKEEELMHVMFIILEMVNGVAYNAIINKEPAILSEIKPTLNACIRGILAQ